MKKIMTVLLVLLVLGTTGCGSKKTKEELTADTEIVETGKTKDVKTNNFTFTNIELKYQDGITTFSSNVINQNKETKNVTIVITLKDEDLGLETKITQDMNGLASAQATQLQTGLVGNYASYTKVHIEVTEQNNTDQNVE